MGECDGAAQRKGARGEEMWRPDELAAMLELHRPGWGRSGWARAHAFARCLCSGHGRCVVIDRETLIDWLTRLKLTAIRDQLDNLLDEAARNERWG